jgi:hypothetical protein
MAKQQQANSTPVVPNFKDVDKAATQAAMAAVAGGRQDPLVVPANAAHSEDAKGVKYSRWTERSVVQQAYRSVTKKGLMDVTVLVKIRQGDKNNGRKVFSHFYINNAESVPENHEQMNERSIGAIGTLLIATGFMPAGGALKGSLLDKMFPQKGQPGTASPLVGKSAVVNVVQTFGPKKDLKTNKNMTDEDGNVIMERRDSGESFLPDAKSAPAAGDDEGDEN